jgi:hypothetical protein
MSLHKVSQPCAAFLWYCIEQGQSVKKNLGQPKEVTLDNMEEPQKLGQELPNLFRNTFDHGLRPWLASAIEAGHLEIESFRGSIQRNNRLSNRNTIDSVTDERSSLFIPLATS